MTSSRFLCPLDCGWYHDEEPADRNFDFAPFIEGEWPPGVDPLAASLVATRLLLAEKIIREHLETHSLIEWVQALQRVKQLLADKRARQEAYEESVVGALNERNTRDARRAGKAEAELAEARETNRRLNHRAQQAESKLATFERAVGEWRFGAETGTYVPLRSLGAIAKAVGREIPDRWELHYQRVEAAEAQVARIRAFFEEMATWCSPHGVAVDYAQRGLDALNGVDPLGLAGPTRDKLAEELPGLTAEDAVEAMQDIAGELYTAQDRLAFVREMCDAADRAGKQITTEQVRAWTQYTGCGGAIVLTEAEADTLAADLLAGRVRTWKARIIDAGSYPAKPGRATMAADRCPQCNGDNTEPWAACSNCAAAGEQL